MAVFAKQLPVYDFVKDIRGVSEMGLAVLVAEAGHPLVDVETLTRGRNGIGDYASIEGLWKFLGYAVIDGRSQRKRSGEAAGIKQGYSPRRHSQIWSFFDDLLIRHQWCSPQRAYKEAIQAHPDAAAYCTENGIALSEMKDLDDLVALGARFDIVTSGYPLGPYGEVYANRRKVTDQRVIETVLLDDKDQDKWTPARCLADAKRLMTKSLIRDIWKAWRRANDSPNESSTGRAPSADLSAAAAP